MRSRLPLLCALAAVLALGCSPDDEPPEDPPTQTPEPEAEEPPPPDDVEGAVAEVSIIDLSVEGSGLYPDGSAADAAVPVDQDAVDAAVAAGVDWLDAHLTDVQAGGAGLVVDAGLTGDPAPVSEGMTDPEHPATGAEYVVTVGARGAPEWVRVSAVVSREDGEASANFVFLPDGEGVSLLAVHAGDDTAVAAP